MAAARASPLGPFTVLNLETLRPPRTMRSVSGPTLVLFAQSIKLSLEVKQLLGLDRRKGECGPEMAGPAAVPQAGFPRQLRQISQSGGTYNCRVIAGTTSKSAHGDGLAIDINVGWSDYWRNHRSVAGKYPYKNRIPWAIVEISRSTAASGAASGITTTPCISNIGPSFCPEVLCASAHCLERCHAEMESSACRICRLRGGEALPCREYRPTRRARIRDQDCEPRAARCMDVAAVTLQKVNTVAVCTYLFSNWSSVEESLVTGTNQCKIRSF
jgi:hypothetical protein